MVDTSWFGVDWISIVLVIVCLGVPLTIAGLFLRRLWKYLERR